jgi:hypothetical protein
VARPYGIEGGDEQGVGSFEDALQTGSAAEVGLYQAPLDTEPGGLFR